MMFATFDLPAAPTALGVLLVAIVIGYYLLRDRSAFMTQAEEIANLRLALDRQAKQHRADIDELNVKMDGLLDDNEVQHREKHAAQQTVTRALASVDVAALVITQARSALDLCDCAELAIVKKALIPMSEMFDRLRAENRALNTPEVR